MENAKEQEEIPKNEINEEKLEDDEKEEKKVEEKKDEIQQEKLEDKKEVNIVQKTKKRGCLEWFCGLFCSCLREEEHFQESPKFVGLINIGKPFHLR